MQTKKFLNNAKSRLKTVNVNYLVLKCDMQQTATSVQKLLIKLWSCHKLN